MADDKILRMQQLVSELNKASDAYYNGRSELMTDYEWDQRFDELPIRATMPTRWDLSTLACWNVVPKPLQAVISFGQHRLVRSLW